MRILRRIYRYTSSHSSYPIGTGGCFKYEGVERPVREAQTSAVADLYIHSHSVHSALLGT
jgi:hypothetical protein